MPPLDRNARPVRRRLAHRGEGGDATRLAIVEAAARRVSLHGADGFRLAQIAEDVGITHPLILHYFGSKRGLVDAVIAHIGTGLAAEVASFLPWSEEIGPVGSPKVEAAFRVLSDRGYGRLIAWAMQQEQSQVSKAAGSVVEAILASMVAFKTQRDGAAPDDQWCQTLRFWVRLTFLAAIGESFAGPVVDLGPAGQQQFRVWLGDQIAEKTGI